MDVWCVESVKYSLVGILLMIGGFTSIRLGRGVKRSFAIRIRVNAASTVKRPLRGKKRQLKYVERVYV